MKNLNQKLSAGCLSIILGISSIFATNIKKSLSTEEKVGISVVATVIGAPLLYILGNKLSYELYKSENGIDMRSVTKRGYKNKISKVDLSQTNKHEYLHLKWLRMDKKWCKNPEN